MKNLLIIILIIFNTLLGFSQPTHYNDVSIVDNKNEVVNESSFSHYYGFTVNNNIYILSYRSNDESNWNHHRSIVTKRDLLLYHKVGNNWVESSNIVQTDYKDNHDTRNYDQYLTRGLSCGHVRVLNSGRIVMLITNQLGYNTTRSIFKYNSVVIFIPNNNNTYTSTRFEPENKNTVVPELCASDTLIISETNNTISVKIVNKQYRSTNETPDGYTTKDNIPYKRKLITTLEFKINDNNVEYNGQYKLIKNNDKSNTIY